MTDTMETSLEEIVHDITESIKTLGESLVRLNEARAQDMEEMLQLLTMLKR